MTPNINCLRLTPTATSSQIWFLCFSLFLAIISVSLGPVLSPHRTSDFVNINVRNPCLICKLWKWSRSTFLKFCDDPDEVMMFWIMTFILISVEEKTRTLSRNVLCVFFFFYRTSTYLILCFSLW